ncbi:hypothetical protein GCM10029978_066250 [Actinoallomurus acanthiterrae]
MAAMSLSYLSQAELAAVTYAVAVLDQSPGLVPAAVLPVLTHPDLRLVVDAQLDAVGGAVVEHHDGGGAVVGYSSGYADDIAERLAAEGLGVLDPAGRAVVALVLLRSVAMPTVKGRRPLRWSAATPVKLSELHHNRRLGKTVVRETVNRLHDAHVLINGRAAGIKPGPVFDRLTPAQRHRIEEDLFMLAAPEDPVAVALQHRRQQPETSS